MNKDHRKHGTDWNQVRIDAAISAIQGVMESGKFGIVLEIDPR